MPVMFSSDEMVPVLEQKGARGAPSRTIWKSPITPRENILACLQRKEYMFLPNVFDMKNITPYILADNRARGNVKDGGEPFVPNPNGEKDVFGIEWVYDTGVRGSIVRPGAPLLNEIGEWRDKIIFPDPDSWDWAGQAERSKEYLSDPLFAKKSCIFTGFFERLISFMDFENAAVTLIDEDEEEEVHALFSQLSELYINYIDHFKQYLGVEVIELHDDWGSQNAPLLSEATVHDMILPHLKHVVDHVHSLGMFMEFHSCGKIERLVPLMIEAGVDMWMGQDINDKKAVVDAFGDKLIVEVEVPELGENATDEEVWQAAEDFADQYIIPGKPVILSLYSAGRSNRPLLTQALYEISRKKLCGMQ